MTDDAGTPGLRLFNTLTRRKEPFQPLDPNNVRMYVCGPTVYDFAHIGNARPAIVFDVLFRLLRHIHGPEHVTYVRNITDVDDKIIARARRDFPDLDLNDAIGRVTETTAAQYAKDVAALGCLPPTHEPRATEHIPGMVRLIRRLLDRGHAYVASGSEGREVLFRVASMPDYGALSRRRLDEQQAGARVAVEAHKENPADFVLWKESDATEPGWPATFDGIEIHGRPGWHIECSAMSEALLGESFDIHGGGLDLIFPHHENEIAQSRCAHGTDLMAKVWMHNEFVQVEGAKMSKSLGNFWTIADVLKDWPGEVVRLAMLMTHYRQPLDLTVARLEEARSILDGWYRRLEAVAPLVPSDPDAEVVAALIDDLATPSALTRIDAGFVEVAPGTKIESIASVAYTSRDRAQRILAAARLLGLLTHSTETWFRAGADEGEVQRYIVARAAAREARNWAEADRIRDELAAMGIQLKDAKDPTTGELVTTWEVKR